MNLEKLRFACQNVEDPMFKLGENIDNVGVVCLMEIGAVFLARYGRELQHYDSLDQWWKEKPMYGVLLHEPERSCSYASYLKQHPYGDEESYNKNVPLSDWLMIPERELELRQNQEWVSYEYNVTKEI